MPRDLWKELCSYDNLLLAYKKARKHKTTKGYVVEFEKDLKSNLLLLRSELLLHCYQPKPLVNFIIKDPKTRKISKSDFRDRVVHHALCNIIEPIFERSFIYDSYANRKGKGTLKAVKRFENFKRKVSKNNTISCYVLKADIRKYFETVDHRILSIIIKKKITDKRIIWLIQKILNSSAGNETNIGMPLGNLTSQFFANVYLNGLDYFVKHELKAKYYIRYVDDFVILHRSREILDRYKKQINLFLKDKLALQLHPEKSRIFPLYKGTEFLGLKIFANHKMVRKKNIRKFQQKLNSLVRQYKDSIIDYDKIYDLLEGWCAYIQHSNSYNLKQKMLKPVEKMFLEEISSKEISRLLKESE